MYLTTKLNSLTGLFLEGVQSRINLDIGQQHLNVLLEHWYRALAQLEGSVVLLQLRKDRAVLKFEFD